MSWYLEACVQGVLVSVIGLVGVLGNLVSLVVLSRPRLRKTLSYTAYKDEILSFRVNKDESYNIKRMNFRVKQIKLRDVKKLEAKIVEKGIKKNS